MSFEVNIGAQAKYLGLSLDLFFLLDFWAVANGDRTPVFIVEAVAIFFGQAICINYICADSLISCAKCVISFILHQHCRG
jgi:hypothetical protein